MANDTNDLHITGNAESDTLLSTDPLALLIGMLLDQQIPMETAFSGPLKLRDRLGALEASTIASHDPIEFVAVMKQSPSVHRFPGSMAGRVQSMCAAIVADWGGDASAIWTSGSPTGAEVFDRLKALPGFGEQKAKIFVALLGKQRGLDAPGWEDASAPYSEPGSYRSVADIVDPESLGRVREFKRAAKAAAKNG
jgi:uncharacterized HhH-GPD family protein